VPQERREDGLTSTPRQKPSWGKGGGWGKVVVISGGVEISSAGGVVAMVHVDIAWAFFFCFFVIKSLLCLKVQKTHAALAMEIKNL